MISLGFGEDKRALNVLCVGCHSDDIEIGCGGTVLRLSEQNPGTTFHWVVFSATGPREQEALHAAKLFTASANMKGPMLRNFRDGFMPFVGAEIKEVFEELKGISTPDVIFTHNRNDAHQDHRLISELTRNTFRNHLILEYEIPKYDGDLGQPNCYVPLSTELRNKKVQYLMDVFQTQQQKHWFEENTFLALMRLRGMECNAPSGYAEAFFVRKMVL